MKLKYKKIILVTTMSTMGVGILTLSVNHNNPKSQMSMNPEMKQQIVLSIGENKIPKKEDGSSDLAESAAVPLQTPASALTATPEPLPVYVFEKDVPKEIKALIKDYYAAKSSCDIDKIKTLLSNSEKAMPLKQLKEKTKFVEGYRNIKCYVKKSFEAGCYIVYAYQEVKLVNINTLAPALDQFYIVTDRNGDFKIYSDDMEPQLKEYYNHSLSDKDVIELKNSTNIKAVKAKGKDKKLKSYWDFLDQITLKSNPVENSHKVLKE